MIDRYERALALIPALLALGAATSLHPRVALHQGLATGSLISTVVLYDALFRNPPIEPTVAEVAAMATVGVGWAATLVMVL